MTHPVAAQRAGKGGPGPLFRLFPFNPHLSFTHRDKIVHITVLFCVFGHFAVLFELYSLARIVFVATSHSSLQNVFQSLYILYKITGISNQITPVFGLPPDDNPRGPLNCIRLEPPLGTMGFSK